MALTDVEVILYSTLLALIITIGVSAFFRYRLPSKSDQVFESNRNSFLETIFGQLEMYDEMWFDFILEQFTKEFGELERGRKDILKDTFKFVPIDEIESQETDAFVNSMKQHQKLQELRERLEGTFQNMRGIHGNFLKDVGLYEKYLHHSFIHAIGLYYWQTNYYVEWLFKNVIVSGCIDSRKNNAMKIIKYLKEDKTINKKPEYIKKFIDKWEIELKRGY